ncbi:MAG: response regulator [Spirochaetes bacterium]|uniref:Response regulator n=1 Tax=Candidatus Ornithospirochaeta stercoripullorum TaxID=2840899 RepID=A0A9D9DZT4_9SPIO|nr:response regulator [Candidatus Ornithospirochaeta stercoripullorum]
MLKAILADDEDIVRNAMVRWIPWKELGLKLVGTAADGEEALSMITAEQPDIVITDIRMPKLDGLDLIKRTKNKLKNTRFIILSGFGEFEYAQKAMSYGVKHYMLKPALKEDLIQTLKEVIAEIEGERNALLNSIAVNGERYGFFLQRSMLMEVLLDSSSIPEIIERSNRITPFDADETLTMLTVQALEPSRFVPQLLSVIGKEGIRVPIYPVSIGGKVYFVLDISALSVLENMKEAIEERGGVLVGVNRGKPAEIVSYFVKENSNVAAVSIYDEDGNEEKIRILPSFRSADDEIVTRYRAVLSGASDPSLMDDAEAILRSKDLDEAEALFIRMAIKSKDYEILFKELGNVRTMEELIDLARAFAEHKMPGSREAFPVDIVRRYIAENFSNPDISLKWISENVVYMNPEYLSRLFQKEMGQRFTDYLNTTRVDEARKLMSAYHQSTVGEIAEKVGYSNPGYFFHIFRRYTGMTPGEYMDKVRKSHGE